MFPNRQTLVSKLQADLHVQPLKTETSMCTCARHTTQVDLQV
jgi:hypothetical protein